MIYFEGAPEVLALVNRGDSRTTFIQRYIVAVVTTTTDSEVGWPWECNGITCALSSRQSS